MKKVLLSLVAFLMIFNTVSAEELEVLENNNEVTESTLTTRFEENTDDENTANENEEDNQEDDYKWAAIQPGSTKTSDGITVSWEYTGITKEGSQRIFNFDLTYTIPEDYEKETLVINPDIFELIAWGQDESGAPKILPGYTIKINVEIDNKSKYNYNYDENSFVIYPKSADELEDMGFERIDSDKKSFNGEDLTVLQKFARTDNAALKALGLKRNEMNNENIDKALKEKEYNGKRYNGIEDLAKYYLDFFNTFYGYGQNGKERVTKLSDFTVNEIAYGIFGGYVTGYEEDNAELMALHFDFLYNYGMGVSLDDEKINDSNQQDYAPGEYMRNESKGDEKIKEKVGKLESETKKDIDMTFHFSGPLLNNPYQGYRLTGNSHLSYTAEKGKVIARYIDVKGNVLHEEIITTGMVNKAYKTSALEFDGYELIKTEGNESGLYQTEDQVVTYIYEFVDGVGGDEVPNTGIDTNSTLEVTTVISMITLVGAIVLRKRFN